MKLLRIREAEERTGIREATWRAWVSQGKVGCVRLGRAVRIPEEEIIRLIREGTTPAQGSR